MTRVSMKQIAQEAGVSIATVSRVVRNNPSVNPELRRRVLEVVKRYNYEPNSNARSLHSKSTGLIALVIPDISNPFFPGIAKAAEEVANLHGFHMLLCNTGGNLQKEKGYISLVRRHQVDGMIVVPAGDQTEHWQQVSRLEVPLVTIDRAVEGIACVRTDNQYGGYLATRHLLALGHEVIGCIAAAWDPKVAGYRQALAEAGREPDERLIFDVTKIASANPGYEGALRLLAQRPDLSAIICASDVMALGALTALEQKGISVPRDVAVAGYDNTILASVVRPALTSVAQPTEELGRSSAEMLIDAIEQRAELEPKVTVLEPRLVVRDSTVAKVTERV